MQWKITLYVTVFLAIFSIACGMPGMAFFTASTPTPAAVVGFEVAIRIATPTMTPTKTPSPTLTATPTIEPSPTPTITVAMVQPAAFVVTVIPSPTASPTTPATATATPELVSSPSISPTVMADPLSPATPPPNPDKSLPSGIITLLAPDQETVLTSNMNELEFKWDWQGDITLERCGSLPGYGFEVRIWPARDGFGPLGAMDAAKNEQDVFLGCDPDTGIRSYALKFLHSAPGVKAGGAGKFLWDVTLVKLNPYQPVIIVPPRLFEISFDYHGSLDPFGEKLSCSNFGSWAEAQAVFLAAGGPSQDPHELDPDGDGQACNELLGG